MDFDFDKLITDQAEAERYTKNAREMFVRGAAIKLSDPPVVLRTADGARVMAWLLVEDKDLIA